MSNRKRGGQPRNQNATRGTVWRDAIRKAIARDKQSLERIAARLLKAAEDGDMAAIRELGDRLDGKAALPVESIGENKIEVQIVRFGEAESA